jgi:hypothetical protein
MWIPSVDAARISCAGEKAVFLPSRRFTGVGLLAAACIFISACGGGTGGEVSAPAESSSSVTAQRATVQENGFEKDTDDDEAASLSADEATSAQAMQHQSADASEAGARDAQWGGELVPLIATETTRRDAPKPVSAVDQRGNVYIVWKQVREENGSVLGWDVIVTRYRPDIDQWCPPKSIAFVPRSPYRPPDFIGNPPEPLVAAGRGNQAIVVWDAPSQADGSSRTLYYSHLVRDDGSNEWSAAAAVPSVTQQQQDPQSSAVNSRSGGGWTLGASTVGKAAVVWGQGSNYFSAEYDFNAAQWLSPYDIDATAGVTVGSNGVVSNLVSNRRGDIFMNIRSVTTLDLADTLLFNARSQRWRRAAGPASVIDDVIDKGIVNRRGDLINASKSIVITNPEETDFRKTITVDRISVERIDAVSGAVSKSVVYETAPGLLFEGTRSIVESIALGRSAEGLELTWNESFPPAADAIARLLERRSLALDRVGQPVGTLVVLDSFPGGQGFGSASSGTRLTVKSLRDGTQFAAWTAVCRVDIDTGCSAPGAQLLTSERRPGKAWSAPRVLPRVVSRIEWRGRDVADKLQAYAEDRPWRRSPGSHSGGHPAAVVLLQNAGVLRVRRRGGIQCALPA